MAGSARNRVLNLCRVKLAFHDADTDFLARILADTSNTRN